LNHNTNRLNTAFKSLIISCVFKRNITRDTNVSVDTLLNKTQKVVMTNRTCIWFSRCIIVVQQTYSVTKAEATFNTTWDISFGFKIFLLCEGFCVATLIYFSSNTSFLATCYYITLHEDFTQNLCMFDSRCYCIMRVPTKTHGIKNDR
jgi:hypothetical protein